MDPHVNNHNQINDEQPNNPIHITDLQVSRDRMQEFPIHN